MIKESISKKIIIIFSFVCALAIGILYPEIVIAQVIELKNPFIGDGNLYALVKALINGIVLPIGGMVAVLAFIYSGFTYVTARGDETAIKTAHRNFLYVAIGTAILL
ncbi:MAG: hypothetical protein M3Q24_00500, partial [bacterium]|nr:hypothetical protein [bacterium]